MRDLPAGTVACGEPVTAIDLDARIATTPKRTIAFDRIVSRCSALQLQRFGKRTTQQFRPLCEKRLALGLFNPAGAIILRQAYVEQQIRERDEKGAARQPKY